MASQYAADLSPEQQRGVVQKTFENLLTSSRKYDPAYSVWTYLKQHLLNAVRQMRAAYSSPGVPKWRDADSGSEAEAFCTGGESLEDAPEMALSGASGRDMELKVDARIVLEAACRLFQDGTEKALRALSHRSTREEAAGAAGYSRRTLDRRLAGLRRYLRGA
jgi:hypothetical protein